MRGDVCAALVQRGDPDRFDATMAAPCGLRDDLFVFYAFNLEVARAPWASKESLISHMRLQWWRDVVDGAGSSMPPAHEVAGPLVDLITSKLLDKTIFDNLISARQFDIDRRAFDGLPEASGYLSATSGGLMLIAGQSLGAKDGDFAVLRAGGLALGVLNLLRAAPALQSVGAGAFDLDDSNFIISLVKLGLENLAIARAGRVGLPPDVRPVLFPLWQAQDLLTRVALAPHLVAEGKLSQSPAKRSFGLLKAGFFGIW